MIIVKKCMKCANVNVNDSLICSGCGSSLVYYQRPIKIDSIGQRDYQDSYSAGSDSGILECPKCGTENELDREFCYSCFTNLRSNPKPITITRSENSRPVQPDPKAASSIIKKCPNCGDLNYSYRDFCQRCNTRLVYNPPPISISESEEKRDYESHEKMSGRIICPHCGAENSNENEYCDSCYKNLIVTKYKKY
jgi:uncharacterized OB-fold protein